MAFFQETKPAREPFLRVPGAVTALIAVLVLAHVARVFAPPALSFQILHEYAFDPAIYSPAFLAASLARAPRSSSVSPGLLSVGRIDKDFSHALPISLNRPGFSGGAGGAVGGLCAGAG